MVPSAARRRWMATAALVALASTGSAAADDYADMVAAERAFAADAAARNVRDAFLTASAVGGVVFSPGPIETHKYWTAKEATADKLEWVPAAAEIASSGDLGYTYGPWRYTPAGAEKPVGFGHFFTVWQKQADGTWRSLADKGITHAEQPLGTEVVRRGQVGFSGQGGGVPAAELMVELRQADMLAIGRVSHELVAPDFVRFRGGELPAAKHDSPALAAAPTTQSRAWAVISAAGDLAATWGGSDAGSWMRVWRRAGVGDPPGATWRLVVDSSTVPAVDFK